MIKFIMDGVLCTIPFFGFFWEDVITENLGRCHNRKIVFGSWLITQVLMVGDQVFDGRFLLWKNPSRVVHHQRHPYLRLRGRNVFNPNQKKNNHPPKTQLEIVAVQLLLSSILQIGKLQQKGYVQWMSHHILMSHQMKSRKGPWLNQTPAVISKKTHHIWTTPFEPFMKLWNFHELKTNSTTFGHGPFLTHSYSSTPRSRPQPGALPVPWS